MEERRRRRGGEKKEEEEEKENVSFACLIYLKCQFIGSWLM